VNEEALTHWGCHAKTKTKKKWRQKSDNGLNFKTKVEKIQNKNVPVIGNILV